MSEYKTETVELKYCEFKTPWNIFEKFRGKRVFNVPNDLSLCVENPELILKSDYDSAQKKIEAQGRAIEKIKEQRDRYASGVSSRDELEQMNQEISVILNTQEDSK